MPLKVTKKNVEQTINLNEKFDIDFSGKRNLKELIGQKIIDRIVERCNNNEGINLDPDTDRGRKVKLKSPYSDEYEESLEFKAAGKSKNDVNMQLTGDMLGLLDIKRIDGNKITIGWNDPEQNPKAHGHMTGKDGKVPKMKRPFFGISNKELKDIKREMNADLKRAIKVKQDEGTAAFNKLVLGLLDEIKDDGSS